SGNWNSAYSWESSTDNINWMAATLFPDNTANTILIQNGHSISIANDLSVDQLIIQTGSTLTHSSGILNVLDGSGDDITIQSGGILSLASSSNPPQFGAGNPTINVLTGGVVKISAAGLTSAAPLNGVNVSNYVYQHQSVLEYTLSGGFATSGVTFFPNVNATTIPVFRITNTSASNILVGAGSNTTFNGIFENNGTATVIWQNNGLKIFRNGIRGTGNIDGSGSGKFIINGSTAELGGTGSLILPTTGGMDIGTTTAVSMISDKVVTGNINLLSDSYVTLGGYDLTIDGSLSGGTATSHIITNGTGSLKFKNLSSSDVIFPVGYNISSFNPVTINNGSGTLYDFSVRVGNSINPVIAYPNYGVNRTWNIGCSGSPGTGVTVRFQYSAGDVNSLFIPGEETDIYLNDGGSWSLKDPNPVESGTGPYTVISTALNFFNAPFVIGKNGGYILPINYYITERVQKLNDKALIKWMVNSLDDVAYFELEKSVNRGLFIPVKKFGPESNLLEYSYLDPLLTNGTILYRVKVRMLTGKIYYSNISAIINNSTGLFLGSVYPNPVINKANIVISTGKDDIVYFLVYNTDGKIVRQWNQLIQEGTNSIQIDASQFSKGTYQLRAMNSTSDSTVSFIKL
ncbi:MAG: T9SS type A sorting domain-containing protein, partial [Bacteroidetes bacterium]|nr:T9SS type A sorting domain-containing protein [Bacteroidota bacterium]